MYRIDTYYNLSQLAVPLPHFLVPRWRGIPAAKSHIYQTTNHDVEQRGAQPSAQTSAQAFRLYWGLMKVGMDVKGGSEEMPWSARPALKYVPGSDASGARNRQVSLACRRPTFADVQMDGWWWSRVPLSLHKHVRSTLLLDIFQTEIPLAGWNAEEANRKPPPKRDRQRAANRTAAGSSVPDKVIFYWGK